MIKANELRIGNLIRWAHEEGYTLKNVTPDILKSLYDYEEDPDDERFSRGLFYKPIPLTSEILLKYGFKIVGNRWKFVHPVYGFSCITVGINTSKVFYVHLKKRIYIDYLHELQNLYFALNRKELIF